jgi:hypothetical protein
MACRDWDSKDSCDYCGSEECFNNFCEKEKLDMLISKKDKSLILKRINDEVKKKFDINLEPILDSKIFEKLKDLNVSNELDFKGALCDLIGLIEDKAPELFSSIDPVVLKWWEKHTKSELEKIKAEALAKLSAREKRILGLK